ncbi:MAG: gamma-glutamyltransferase [Candidatus Latescibacteria bacterium]|nr:gamma-glutamyltransferase [Candidatus Latescibacterota bacterium]
MIASAHPLASLAGLRILMDGGNAIDAAVATAAALNVVEPYMSGLGGDGFMHVYSARDQDHKVLDYMGLSPAGVEPGMLDGPKRPNRGPLTPLVPGACGGWLEALQRYGTMDASRVFAPAIEYAEDGYALTVKNHQFSRGNEADLGRYPASAATFLHGGRARRPGEILTQRDLARTFRAIAEGGAEVFYRGEIADRIFHHMAEAGGLLTRGDLAAFTPEWQDPICSTYRGFTVFAPRPPCQAVQYLQTLNMLEAFDVAGMGHNTVESLHMFIEAAKLANADRVVYAGIEKPPTAGLLSKDYASERRGLIGDRARPTGGDVFTLGRMDDQVEAGDPYSWMRSECTTHFDTIDAEGNAVAVTQSLGSGFGSAMVVPGTGITLNNLMRWFDLEPESPNAIGPSKKIEMCMSPAQVWDDAGLRMLIGTPGSYGILQTTPQMMMNVLDHGMNIQAAIEAPRVKATSPGLVVDAETRVPEDVLGGLAARDHEINRLGDWSAAVGGGQGIAVDAETGAFMGGADPRRDGYVIGW